MNAKAQAILNATPPHLRQQLVDVLLHADSLARTGIVPQGDGGSIAAFFNKQPVEIRATLQAIKAAADLPRDRPFVEKETPAERYASFGLEPDSASLIGDALDGLEVQNRTIERLGGDDSRRPDDPISRRDQIAAAFDLHSEGE